MGCWFARARLIVLCGLGLLVLILPGSVRADGLVFVCPSVDLAGRPVIDLCDDGTTLFCRYEAVPNDFFCKYFLSTGLLQQDHDNGFCPPVASIGSVAPSVTPTDTPNDTPTPTETPTNTPTDTDTPTQTPTV